MSILSRPEFHDEQAAYDYVEARLWPHGPTCPKCQERERVSKMGGKSTRIGAYKCYKCRKPFTVKVDTIFESSHVKMHIWLQAIYLICASKKGISANQLHRTLGVTLKTAWFIGHRVREAMRTGAFEVPMASGSGTVEVDETFIGVEHKKRPKIAYHHKMKVLSLVHRESGQARSFVVDNVRKSTLLPIMAENIAREAHIMTDEAKQYAKMADEFAGHDFVNHNKKEYVRGNIHTNTVEGFFSIFKRGMKGTYQHCKKKHLHRYLAEFDFRYNNRIANGMDDRCRADNALLGAAGKRLKYRQPYETQGVV